MKKSKSSVQRNIELINPLKLCLVEFAHATLRNQNKIVYEVYKGGISFQKQKRMLVAFTEHLMYSGKNDDQDMFKITSTQLKVAVLNKSTNRMKLYDADYFILRPIQEYHQLQAANEKTSVEQIQDLALEFGSKHKKKAVHSRLKFQSQEEDLIDASLIKEMSENAPLIIKTSLSTESATEAIIPPQNKNATDVAKVYNIFDIISQQEYQALESITLFRNISRETLQSLKKDLKLKDIVLHYLELYYQSLTPSKEKLLCYLHYMLCFMGLNYKDWKKKDPIPEVPEPFKTKLMSRYVINKSMPQRMKDKLLADAMVLYFNINNFFLDCKLLASSTKVSIKRLVNIAYALGCHVSSNRNEDTKRIELKLPLYKHERFERRK